jgi:hypothetical protein
VVMLQAAETRRDVRLPYRGGADGVSSVRGDGRRCLSQPVDYRSWEGGGSRWEGACKRRVWGDVNGVQRGCIIFCISHFLLRRAIEIAV